MTDRSVLNLVNPPTFQRAVWMAHFHGRSLRQRELNRFLEYGVRAIDLVDPCPVLADRVVFEGELFYFADEVKEAGEPVFTMLVISNGGPIDIAAWSPVGNRLAVRYGYGFALGERQIHHPYPLIAGLPVFRSPVGWLRAGRCGIVILLPQFARAVLADVPVLVAEDEQHREELQQLFAFAGPQIVVGEFRCQPAGEAA